MTLDEKYDILNEYRDLISNIQFKDEKYELISQKIISVKSIQITDMPRGGTPLTMEDLLAEKMELEEEIRVLLSDVEKTKNYIYMLIFNNLDDAREIQVLRFYFVELMNIKEIAVKMKCSQQTIKNIFSDAIEHFDV